MNQLTAVNNQLRQLLDYFNICIKNYAQDHKDPQFKKALLQFIFQCQQPQSTIHVQQQNRIIRQYLMLVFQTLINIRQINGSQSTPTDFKHFQKHKLLTINQILRLKVSRLSQEADRLFEQTVRLKNSLNSSLNNQVQTSFKKLDFSQLKDEALVQDIVITPSVRVLQSKGKRLTFSKKNEEQQHRLKRQMDRLQHIRKIDKIEVISSRCLSAI